jgi:putative endonuclease
MRSERALRDQKRRAWRRGHIAEAIASIFLFLKGYRILARRFKTPVGEIDLIARRGRWTVFVEVKTRRTLSEAAECISLKNRQRVLNAARWYLARHPVCHHRQSLNPHLSMMKARSKICATPNPFIRFDAILLTPPLSIRHIQNAWQETG